MSTLWRVPGMTRSDKMNRRRSAWLLTTDQNMTWSGWIQHARVRSRGPGTAIMTAHPAAVRCDMVLHLAFRARHPKQEMSHLTSTGSTLHRAHLQRARTSWCDLRSFRIVNHLLKYHLMLLYFLVRFINSVALLYHRLRRHPDGVACLRCARRPLAIAPQTPIIIIIIINIISIITVSTSFDIMIAGILLLLQTTPETRNLGIALKSRADVMSACTRQQLNTTAYET